jgi:flagellar hook-associated protein 2
LAQAARDASFDLNGEPITEPTNGSIKLLEGLTVNLVSSGSAAVTVAKSSQSLSSALSTLTTQFNNAVSLIAKQTEFKAAAKSSSSATSSASAKPQIGALLGNVQVEQLQQSLLSGISSAAGSGLSANAIGLTISSGGQLSFSSTVFGGAYAKNPAAVDNLVKGMVKVMQRVVGGAVGSAGTTPSGGNATTSTTTNSGFLQSASTSLKAAVTSLDQEISQQQQIESSQVLLLEQQFSAAEAATGSASTTLAYIGSLLSTSNSTTSGG